MVGTTRFATLTLAAVAFLATAFSPMAPAQEAEPPKEKKVKSIISSQLLAKKKFEKIKGRLLDIASKLEMRGDTYHATKLRQALEKAGELDITGGMEKVIEFLKNSRIYSASDKQQELLKAIDQVLDILLDRKSYEELQNQLDELKKATKKLEELEQRQKEHIEKVKKLEKEIDQETPADIKELRRKIDEIQKAQRRLLERTNSADVEKDLKAIQDVLDGARSLLKDQESLYGRTRDARGLTRVEEEALRKARERLEKAAKTQAALLEAQQQSGPRADALQGLRDRLARDREDQKGLARETDEKMSTALAADLDGAAKEVEALLAEQKRLKELNSAYEKLASLADEQERLKASTSDPAQRKEQLARIQNKAFKRGIDAAGALRKLAQSAKTPAAKAAFLKAAEEAEHASETMLRSAKNAEKSDFNAMKDQMGQAGAGLRKALDSLKEVTGSKSDQATGKVSMGQRKLASKASSLGRKIAGMKPSDPAVPGEKEAKDKAAREVNVAANRMEEAAVSIEGGDRSKGLGKQKEAEARLNQALQSLRKLIEAKRKPGPDLVGRQQNQAGKASKAAKDLKKAADNAIGGEEGAVGGKLKEAADKAAEASESLKKAADRMKAGDRTGTAAAQAEGRKLMEEAEKLAAKASELRAADADRALATKLQKEAAAAARAAAEDVARTAQSLSKRGAAKESQALSDVARAAQSASKSMKEAAASLKEGKKEAAAASQEQGLKNLEKALEGLKKFLKDVQPETEGLSKEQKDLAARASALARLAEKLGGQGRSPSRAASAARGARKFGNAGSRMRSSSKNLGKGRPREAEKDQEQSLDRLKEGIKELAELRKRLGEKIQPNAEAIAREQKRLAEKAKELADKMKSSSKNAASAGDQARSGAMERASQSTGKAGGKMGKSSQSVGKQDFSKSRKEQKEALQELEKAERELKKMSREAARKKKERELKALQKSQKETEEMTKKTKEELERLRKLLEARNAGNAANSMNQAGHKVSSLDLKAAKEKMEEARQYLNKAKNRLKEEERQYANLAQEQLIFLIKKKLKEALKVQEEKVNAVTEELAAKVNMGRRLRRSEIRKIRKAGRQQDELAEQVHKEIEKKIEKEAKVFAYIIRSIVEDMRSVSEALTASPPQVDDYPRSLQKEIVSNMKMLIKAFTVELKRKQNQQKPGGGQSGGNGPPRLVHPIAEIQALKFKEMELRKGTQALSRLLREGEELTPVQKKMLDRLTHRQGSIAQVLKEFLEFQTRQTEGSRR